MTTPPSELRLPPLPFAQWDERTRRALLAHLRRPELYLSDGPDAQPMPLVMELFAQHVPVGESFMTFTDTFVSDDSTLEPRLRELLILRVAWRTGSGYEWNQHHRMGGEEGLTSAQLAAVAVGATDPVWAPEEAALLTAADEMIDHFEVSDATWKVLAGAFAPAQLFELLFVVGGYLALAAVLNSIGLRGEISAGKGG
jgi:4-carboxymuconolactone decarboxylase